jgi:hypothetical protein
MNAQKKWNIISAAAMFMMALFIFYVTKTRFVLEQAVGGGPFANSAFYPQVIAGVMIFLAVLLAASTLFKRKKPQAEEKPAPLPEGIEDPGSGEEIEVEELQEKPTRLKILAVAGILVVYTVLVDLFGYWLTTPVFMLVLFKVLDVKNWIAAVLLAVTSTAVIYGFFSEILDVVLPYGKLGLFG